MVNEAIAVGVPTKVYLELAFQLRKSGDLRAPDQVVALAIKGWLASRVGTGGGQGYQWKDLFLPDGTDLRMRYRGVWHYASVEGDRLMYGGEPVSPREWGLTVTGNVRNPWRDVWIRRSISDSWSRASASRAAPLAREAGAPGADRRRTARRVTD